jgi:adenine-specific DNA-methyltransferase
MCVGLRVLFQFALRPILSLRTEVPSREKKLSNPTPTTRSSQQPFLHMSVKVKDNWTIPLFLPDETGDDERFLQTQIITYIGNKRALLPFIGKGLDAVRQRLNKNKLDTLDLFSGSGVVARYLKQYSRKLTTNDLENYSRISNSCYLSNRTDALCSELASVAAELRKNIRENLAPGFITEMYSPKDENNITEDDRCFYTRENAMFLDTARKEIEKLPCHLRHYLLAPLLARASVHANTSGVFKGFYKNEKGVGQFGGTGKDALTRITGKIDIDIPVFSRFSCECDIRQGDSNQIVSEVAEADVAYLDPPYNQHPYGSNYFMLNLLANYRRPEKTSRISGIPIDWNRSRYNQKAEAEDALFALVDACPAKFIIISYNSEGFISHDRFMDGLSKRGKVTVLETSYNTFRGSRNLNGRSIHVTEFLYLIEKN